MKKLITIICAAVGVVAPALAGIVYDWGSWTTDPNEVVESEDHAQKVILFTNPEDNLALGSRNDQGGMPELFDGNPNTSIQYGQSAAFLPVFNTPVHLRELRIYVKDSDIWQFGMAARSGITGLDIGQIPGIRAGVGGDPNSAYVRWSPPYGPHLGDTATGNRYLSIKMDDGSYLQPCIGNLLIDTGLQRTTVYAVEWQLIGDPVFTQIGNATVGNEDGSEIIHVVAAGMESWTFSSLGSLTMSVRGKVIKIVTLDESDEVVSTSDEGFEDVCKQHVVKPAAGEKIRIEAWDLRQPIGSAMAGTYSGSEIVYDKSGDTETWTFTSAGEFTFTKLVYLSINGGEEEFVPLGKEFYTADNETTVYCARPFEEPEIYGAGVSAVGGNVTVCEMGASTLYTFSGESSMTLDRGGLVEILLVGGGGGGGGTIGAGGGAGGFIHYEKMYFQAGTYSVGVGAGGVGGVEGTKATSGGNSYFGDLIAYGGGGGGSYGVGVGIEGGSGGGSCCNETTIAAGYPGQGYAGGAAVGDAAGGGGGASAAGESGIGGVHSYGANGGDGRACSITGEEIWYAGGGGAGSGGGAYNNNRALCGGKGGKGGGGSGGYWIGSSCAPQDGVDGLGGGGGGSGYPEFRTGGKGGSGTVIVSVLNCEPDDDIPDVNIRDVTASDDAVSAKFTYEILELGADETEVEVAVEYGVSENNLNYFTPFGSVSAVGKYQIMLSGLSEAKTYYARVRVTGKNGGKSGLSAIRSFTTATISKLPVVYGLYEVKLEGGANVTTDLSTLDYGSKDNQLHAAEVPLDKFYRNDWNAGETWAYKGYMFFKAGQRLDFVTGQNGLAYIKIDDPYNNFDDAGGHKCHYYTGQHEGKTSTWLGYNTEDVWLPIEFRVGCESGTPGPYGGSNYQLKYLRNLNWGESWIRIPNEFFRMYLGAGVSVDAVTRIGNTLHANIAINDPAAFGAELRVRHGSDVADIADWSTEPIADGSFEISDDDAYYQIYAVAGEKEYVATIMAVGEAKLLEAEKPEISYSGLSNRTFGSVDIGYAVVSTGDADTTDVIVRYGTLPDRLEYELRADDLGTGSGTLTLANLVPDTEYYLVVSTVNANGTAGDDSELVALKTMSDTHGMFVPDPDSIQVMADFALDGTGGDALVVSAELASNGGDDSVVLKAIVSTSEDMSAASTNTMVLTESGLYSVTLDGVETSTKYYGRIFAEGESGYFMTPVRDTTTKGGAVISSTRTILNLGSTSIYYTLSDVGVGGQTMVTLYIDGEEIESHYDTETKEYGFWIQHPDLRSHEYYFKVSNTTAGGEVIESETAKYSYTSPQNAYYYWTGAQDNLWSNANNWYCPQAEDQHISGGAPNGFEATVFFQQVDDSAMVEVDGDYKVNKLIPYKTDLVITFVGITDDAKITINSALDGGEGSTVDGENGHSWGSTFIFKDMTVLYNCEIVPFPHGKLVFDHAIASVSPNNDATCRYSYSSIELLNGADFTIGRTLQIHNRATRFVIDDSTAHIASMRFPIFASDIENIVEFRGASPVLEIWGSFQVYDQGVIDTSSATMLFDVPAHGYESAPVVTKGGGSFNAEEHPLVIKIASESKLYGSGMAENIPLIDFKNDYNQTQIHTEGISFATTRQPESTTFFWLGENGAVTTENRATYLNFTYKPRGLIIFIK